jgi:hypothetical protein
MRGYGLPRNDDVAHPDKGDGGRFGLKGFKLHSPKKRAARRRWKKRERLRVRASIRKEAE